MKKMMLIGETHAGKSSLIKALSGQEFQPRRAMALQYFGQFINTPGEFIENHFFFPALITTSADCHILAMVQDASSRGSLFPPLFASMFNRRVIGVITKIDSPQANVERAQLFLKNAGIKETLCCSSITGTGIAKLRELIR